MIERYYYVCRENIDELLSSVPYTYRARGEYALSTLGVNNRPKPSVSKLYVSRDDIEGFKRYLEENGVEEVPVYDGHFIMRPNLVIDVVSRLPTAMRTNKRVLNTKQLLEEIVKGMPRLVENHPEIIRKLKRIA